MGDKKSTSTATATVSVRKRCPICGEPSYSAAGIHPQCATVQAEAPRLEQLKADKKAQQKKPQQRSWKKKCLKCGTEVHVRRKVCDCGHDFSPRGPAPY
ncbi:MAG: hypothetical protein GTO03_13430 [Planctomycetales bacterium]|nr:hypothetical protein [Planctomycetales bacterium]